MNRWYVAAAAVVVVGVSLAFLVVPFDNGGCPTLAECRAWGSVPRIATLVVTAILALVLCTIGAASSDDPRR